MINQLKAEMENVESQLGNIGSDTHNMPQRANLKSHSIHQAPGYPSSEYQKLNLNPPS